MKPKRPLHEEEPHAYTDDELKEHLAHRTIKNVLERINAHNYDLILATMEWTDYLAGKSPNVPLTDIGRLVNPKMFKPVNDADRNIRDLVAQMKNYGEGHLPFVPVLMIAYNTSLTLVERLARLKPTPHITRAEEAIRQIFYYARYNGYETMSKAEYDAKLDELCKTFIDECSANAALLSSYVLYAKARLKENGVAETICRRNSHEIQMEEAVRTAKTTILKDKREIIKAVIDNRTELDEAEKPTHDPRELQRAAVRRIMQEAVAKKKPISLHEACRRAWTDLKGGYNSAKNLYCYCNAHKTEF